MTFEYLKSLLTPISLAAGIAILPMSANSAQSLPYELVKTGELISLIKDYKLEEHVPFEIESGYAIGRITDLKPRDENTYFHTSDSNGEPVFAGVIRGLNVHIQVKADAYLVTAKKEGAPFDFNSDNSVYLCIAHSMPVNRCHPLLK